VPSCPYRRHLAHLDYGEDARVIILGTVLPAPSLYHPKRPIEYILKIVVVLVMVEVVIVVIKTNKLSLWMDCVFQTAVYLY